MVNRLSHRRTACSPIGLDAGRTAVRAAQLARTGDRWNVTTLASWHPLRGGADVFEDDGAMTRTARWLQRVRFHGRQTIAGLSAPNVELHAMELPAGNPADRQQAAHHEIERLMNFGEGTAETDCWDLPESRSMSSTAIGVAASKTSLDTLVALCLRAKLDLLQVDATTCALARFGVLYRGLSPGHEDVWGVLDLGGRMSRLILCMGETPVLARAFDYGGESWTKKLASSLGVSEEAAQQHKCDHGFAKLSRGSQDASSTTQTAQAVGEMNYNVLRSDLDAMIGELERSYRYVMQCFRGKEPGPLILVGGGAQMGNLDSLVSEKVGIEVIVPLPEGGGPNCRLEFNKVAGQMREPLVVFAAAIGLAVQE